MTEIKDRKDQHLDIVLTRDVAARGISTGLEAYRLVHNALPEMDLDSVDISTQFLGYRLAAPLLISSMTGGSRRGASINRSIAMAAQRLGLAFGVGSQRVALEDGGAAGLTVELRRLAPDVPILANLGAAQIRGRNGLAAARRAVDMIEADALIVHLNPVQEAVQRGGDRNWSAVLDALARIASGLTVPLVVKEVGFGISGGVAQRLVGAGVRCIDVAGAGGTSWAAVEAERAPTLRARLVADAFRDWGVPTATAVKEVRRACPDSVVIASGGIMDGIDAAKAIRLGADLVGQAAGALPAALKGADALGDHLSAVIEQLRIACFATGSANLAALRRAPMMHLPTGRAVPRLRPRRMPRAWRPTA